METASLEIPQLEILISKSGKISGLGTFFQSNGRKHHWLGSADTASQFVELLIEFKNEILDSTPSKIDFKFYLEDGEMENPIVDPNLIPTELRHLAGIIL